MTAEVEARSRNEILEIQIDPTLVCEADQQLTYCAVFNLIQNALKYTHAGGKAQVRGNLVREHIVVEVEDECGGLLSNTVGDLFKPPRADGSSVEEPTDNLGPRPDEGLLYA